MKLQGIFLDYKNERDKLKHPGWVLTIIIMAYFIIGTVLAELGPDNLSDDGQAKFAIITTGVTLLIFLLGAKFLGKHSFKSLGFTTKGLVKWYIPGLIIGFILFSATVLIASLMGMQHLSKNDVPFSVIAIFIITFIVQGASEEVMFRSVLFPEISARFGLIPGLIGSSILFALIHAGSSTMGVVNMFFFGLMMALAYYLTQSIFLTAGMHMMWNFAEGNIYGVSVSGHSIEKMAFLKSYFTGNQWLTGTTSFGTESGLICTGVLIVAIVIFSVLIKKKYYSKV